MCPQGINAFNKFDVNRDGRISRQDAAIVDGFVGKSYHNVNDVLGAVVATNVNAAGTVFKGDPTTDATTPRSAFNLVDAELNDDGDIKSIGVTSDFGLIKTALGAQLVNENTPLTGSVSTMMRFLLSCS